MTWRSESQPSHENEGQLVPMGEVRADRRRCRRAGRNQGPRGREWNVAASMEGLSPVRLALGGVDLEKRGSVSCEGEAWAESLVEP